MPTSAFRSVRLAALCAACAAFVTAPAWADSMSAASASSAGSASLGSISGSIQNSSNSSSKTTNVATGDYRLIELAAAPDRPGLVRMTLRAVAPVTGDAEFQLLVPQDTVAQAGLDAGQVVRAQQRAYGLEFALAATPQPFFLVLHDDWYRELQTQAVVL